MGVSIILPTYNESKNIKRIVKGIFGSLPAAEIIIVDDNSPDGTGMIAEKLAKNTKVIVIHRKKRLGLSTAVVAGFKKAKGDIIGVMDADLSHPPEMIPKLLVPIKNKKADFVIGSRRIKCGKVHGWPIHRRIISLGATLMARVFTDVKDPMSGFFFMKREVIKGIRFTSRGYKICLEIIVKGKYNRILEIPYIFNNRRYGSSKLNFKEYIQYFIDWVRLL